MQLLNKKRTLRVIPFETSEIKRTLSKNDKVLFYMLNSNPSYDGLYPNLFNSCSNS